MISNHFSVFDRIRGVEMFLMSFGGSGYYLAISVEMGSVWNGKIEKQK